MMSHIFKLSLITTHMKIQIYKTLDRPTLSEGSESWTVRPNDGKRLVSRNVFHEEDCVMPPSGP
jgi:hypothetical protein